jgi:acyl carrier protein
MALTPHNFGGDSLERVELVMALEEAFDIEIPDEDAKRFRTIQDAINYVRRRKKGGDSN